MVAVNDAKDSECTYYCNSILATSHEIPTDGPDVNFYIFITVVNRCHLYLSLLYLVHLYLSLVYLPDLLKTRVLVDLWRQTPTVAASTNIPDTRLLRRAPPTYAVASRN